MQYMWFAGPMSYQDPEVIRRLLTETKRWAIVGLSSNRERAAHTISAFLQRVLDKEIVPVHPKAEVVHGETGYATLAEVPGSIDVVDIFLRPDLADAMVDEAIAVGAKAVWLPLDVVCEPAAERAETAGLDVVMNACPAIEAPKLGLS